MTCEIYYIVLKSSPDLARCREVKGVYVFVLRINTIFFVFFFFVLLVHTYKKNTHNRCFFRIITAFFFQKYNILVFLKMW